MIVAFIHKFLFYIIAGRPDTPNAGY